MSTSRRQRGDTQDPSSSTYSHSRETSFDGSLLSAASPNPTYAAFSPATLSSSNLTASSAAKRRSTILVHQKSPLLLATPPQITRALAYSHPFLLPLNKVAGLLTWTTGDAWESFLVVAVFWAAVLYGDVAIRYAGPVALVLLLILGMYARRFSPLSSSGWSEPEGSANPGAATKQAKAKGKANNKSAASDSASNTTNTAATGSGAGHARSTSEATNTRHQKTLDEIVETLKEFTGRCNILMEPLLELTDFLSTQRTPTSATTRPALTTLFTRIMLCTPFWVALTFPPWRVVTARRVVLVVGTIVLTWHARVVKAGRTILWRSASVRRLAALLTGLEINIPSKPAGTVGANGVVLAKAGDADVGASGTTEKKEQKGSRESELTRALRRARGGHDAGVRFTFIIYENQRRWVGLGWTTSLFAYERSAWTDEHNTAVPPRDQFELPEVEDGSNMRWRWVEGSRWRVDGVPDEAVMGTSGYEKDGEWDYDGEGGKMGWVYYDNKWQYGRRGQDGWGRFTRRRKWYRDAELVEFEEEDEEDANSGSLEEHTPTPGSQPPPSLPPRTPISPVLDSPYTTTSETMSMPELSASTATIKPADKDKDPEKEKDGDDDAFESASVLSTSSRSTTSRFKLPLLRRRVTDTHRSVSAATAASATDDPVLRSRRASEVISEDDAASLGAATGLQVQKDRDQWGIGDEAVMSLE